MFQNESQQISDCRLEVVCISPASSSLHGQVLNPYPVVMRLKEKRLHIFIQKRFRAPTSVGGTNPKLIVGFTSLKLPI